MITLIFPQVRPPVPGGEKFQAQSSQSPFDYELAQSVDEASYWVIGIIFSVCVLYMALGVFVAYRISYQNPKKQAKWLKEKYPENSN